MSPRCCCKLVEVMLAGARNGCEGLSCPRLLCLLLNCPQEGWTWSPSSFFEGYHCLVNVCHCRAVVGFVLNAFDWHHTIRVEREWVLDPPSFRRCVPIGLFVPLLQFDCWKCVCASPLRAAASGPPGVAARRGRSCASAGVLVYRWRILSPGVQEPAPYGTRSLRVVARVVC